MIIFCRIHEYPLQKQLYYSFCDIFFYKCKTGEWVKHGRSENIESISMCNYCFQIGVE